MPARRGPRASAGQEPPRALPPGPELPLLPGRPLLSPLLTTAWCPGKVSAASSLEKLPLPSPPPSSWKFSSHGSVFFLARKSPPRPVVWRRRDAVSFLGRSCLLGASCVTATKMIIPAPDPQEGRLESIFFCWALSVSVDGLYTEASYRSLMILDNS